MRNIYCFKKNDDFLPFKNAKGIGIIRKKDDSDALQECIADPDKWLARSEIMKDSRTTTAGVIKLSNGEEVFIKRFNNKGFIYTLKYLFREARPFRVWKAAWAFEQNNIPTPLPMAAMADYKNGIPQNAYLIRHTVPNIISTLDFFAKLKDDKNILTTTTKFLQANKATVYASANSKQLIKTIAEKRIDFIIADYHLDDETGTQVIETIRSLVGEPIPALFITGDVTIKATDDIDVMLTTSKASCMMSRNFVHV